MNYRANIERNARLILEKKQVKLIHLHNELNSHHQTKRVVYEFLETAFKRSNSARTEKFYKQQYAEHLLECEKFTREQIDRKLAEFLEFMKILTINFHILITQESKLAENDKDAENQLNYASIFLKKETFKHERNKLLHERMKREKTILSLRNQLFHET
jgi:tRNA nucleotidyltransferase/poly(A) polymerase